MPRPRILLLAAGLFSGVFASCQRYENLSADAFLERLGQEAEAQLVDVRTPEEFAAGHLPGAVNIDWLADGFLDQAQAVLDPARPVMLYCRTGKRSAEASSKLAAAGFPVRNLLGGYAGWSETGLPVLRSEDDAAEAEYAVTLLAPGTPAPDFTLIDLEGNLVSLSDFRGRNVVLVFWASWCPDCRAEVPDLKQMAASAATPHPGLDPGSPSAPAILPDVAFVSVSFDREFETLLKFAAEQELPGVQLFDPSGKADSSVASAFGVRWIPSLYLIDPEGNVVFGTVLASKIAAALGGYPARLLAPGSAPVSSFAPGTPGSAAASHQPCEDDSCAL